MGVERWIAVIMGALENLVHAGIIFGWPTLVYVLKDIGYYKYTCLQSNFSSGMTTISVEDALLALPASSALVPSSDGSCESQDAALVLVYTVTTVILTLSMLPSGMLLLYAGTRISRIIATVMMISGYLCLGLSSPAIPELLYPTAILLGMGGIIIILSTFELANLFPSQKSTIIGIMNGCYDTATVMFLLVKYAFEQGVPLAVMSFVFAASALFFNINNCLLPKDHIPWPLPPRYRLQCACVASRGHDDDDDKEACHLEEMKLNGVTNGRQASNYQSCTQGTQTWQFDNMGFEMEEQSEENHGHDGIDVPPSLSDVGSKHLQQEEQADESNSQQEQHGLCRETAAEQARNEAFPTFVSCLKSPMFILMSFWVIVIQVQLLFVLGIVNSWLTWLADGDLTIVSWYTNVLAIVSILSLLGGFLGGFLLDWKKLRLCRSTDDEEDQKHGPYTDLYNCWLAVSCTTILSITYSVCMLFRVLPLQYLTFTLLTLCRSMLYGVSAGVVPVTFPMRYYGLVYGMVYLMIGVFSSFQYPLFILIEDVLLGDPAYVMIGFIILNILTFVYPAYIVYYAKMKTKELRLASSQEAID